MAWVTKKKKKPYTLSILNAKKSRKPFHLFLFTCISSVEFTTICRTVPVKTCTSSKVFLLHTQTPNLEDTICCKSKIISTVSPFFWQKTLYTNKKCFSLLKMVSNPFPIFSKALNAHVNVFLLEFVSYFILFFLNVLSFYHYGILPVLCIYHKLP